MSANILDGKQIAKDILEDVSGKVSELKLSGWDPKLISIKVGANPAVDLYIRNQRLKAEQVGIIFEEKEYPYDISANELQAAIANFNVDPQITGIFLQRPVPESIPIKTLQKAIHPLKDVEGMHPTSIGNIVYNELELGPCTAMASVELLRRTGQDLKGLDVVVIGHSEIVGKPIAFLLMAEGATVTVCHHMTKDVADHSRRADAVFVAVGKPNLITADMLKFGATLIDIGINRVTDEQGKSRIVGDSDFDSCFAKAGWITPVPGGVGPVTVSYLMRNSVSAAQRLKSHYEAQFQNTVDSTF
ncbi:MAG: bifunctional 5,10-methylenetetrahydrofolate dehydrogenase/5,10-methenyltetrahydrofolate cyclohydrolase [Deltaproteobacteria bacterium]|nr:bifunctional 5,10-methylenetetrahydrofolate dehydrogenase/5,10-methenyltetrahydrofolate cyclohydrolase [Deltaproteobacteria bacterium]